MPPLPQNVKRRYRSSSKEAKALAPPAQAIHYPPPPPAVPTPPVANAASLPYRSMEL